MLVANLCTKHLVLWSELEYLIMSTSYSSENGCIYIYQTLSKMNLASFPGLFQKSDLGMRVQMDTICIHLVKTCTILSKNSTKMIIDMKP